MRRNGDAFSLEDLRGNLLLLSCCIKPFCEPLFISEIVFVSGFFLHAKFWRNGHATMHRVAYRPFCCFSAMGFGFGILFCYPVPCRACRTPYASLQVQSRDVRGVACLFSPPHLPSSLIESNARPGPSTFERLFATYFNGRWIIP